MAHKLDWTCRTLYHSAALWFSRWYSSPVSICCAQCVVGSWCQNSMKSLLWKRHTSHFICFHIVRTHLSWLLCISEPKQWRSDMSSELHISGRVQLEFIHGNTSFHKLLQYKTGHTENTMVSVKKQKKTTLWEHASWIKIVFFGFFLVQFKCHQSTVSVVLSEDYNVIRSFMQRQK